MESSIFIDKSKQAWSRNNRYPSIGFNYCPNAKTTLVGFSGLLNQRKSSCTPFEWVNVFESFPNTNKLYIRDPWSCWYQNGFYGYDSIEKSREKLSTILKGLNSSQVIFIGNSAGGFAALMYGILCKATDILVFSPQTNINLAIQQHKNKEIVYTYNSRNLYKALTTKQCVTNIDTLLPQYNGNIEIHYALNSKPDREQADNLTKTKPNFVLYDHDKHGLILKLKKEKKLRPIITSKLVENP